MKLPIAHTPIPIMHLMPLHFHDFLKSAQNGWYSSPAWKPSLFEYSIKRCPRHNPIPPKGNENSALNLVHCISFSPEFVHLFLSVYLCFKCILLSYSSLSTFLPCILSCVETRTWTKPSQGPPAQLFRLCTFISIHLAVMISINFIGLNLSIMTCSVVANVMTLLV